MSLVTKYRGHVIVRRPADNCWYYEDGVLVSDDWKNRPCGHCGRENTPEGHDGCLGTLPGVINACCGHGRQEDAYVQFEGGHRIAGAEAAAFQKTHRNQEADNG